MSTTSTDPRAAVLDRIKELPPLPLVVHELISVMRDTECSGEEINRILSSDQALASKILRLVNSSFYGLPGRASTSCMGCTAVSATLAIAARISVQGMSWPSVAR